MIVDIGVRICGLWRVCIFSYGYWFREKLSQRSKLKKLYKKIQKRLKDLLESRGVVKLIWIHAKQKGKVYHNRHLLVNDLIMKIKYGSKRMKIWNTTDAYVVTFFSIVFYYSNSSKSYFVDVFLHISLVCALVERWRKGWKEMEKNFMEFEGFGIW